jgi:hypothetical protein
MALKIPKSREVLYPVKARMLKDDGSGEAVDVPFKVKYLPMSRSEFRAKMRELNANEADHDDTSPRELIRQMYDEKKLSEYDDWLASRVVGWDDVDDEDGKPIPFTRENYEKVMEIAPVASAVDFGLWNCSREEPAKN